MRLLYLLSIFFLSFPFSIYAQNEWGYEYQGEIPVFIDSLQARLTYPLAYRNYILNNQNTPTLLDWKAAARAKVFECMGERPPLPEKWDMEIIAEEQREGYRAQKVEFSLSRWYRVKAYLLIPDGKQGKMPAVMVMHDHGAHLSIGKEKVVRPFGVSREVLDDADAWVNELYNGQYLGDYLAKNGYVVFAIDMPLWGERGRKEGANRQKYDVIAGNMMMAGVNLCAFNHYDDLASLDFLCSLPFVDTDRIAATGLSMGAYRTWMLAALSGRIKVACPVCWMVSTDAQLTTKYGRKENGGFANSIPFLRNYLDYPDIASISAPCHMMIIAGRHDKLFPIPGVEKSFAIMHEVWKAFGAENNLSTHILEQKHECTKANQQMILDYLKQHL